MKAESISTPLSMLGDIADIGENARQTFSKWIETNGKYMSDEYARGIRDATNIWTNELLIPLGKVVLEQVKTEVLMKRVEQMLKD